MVGRWDILVPKSLDEAVKQAIGAGYYFSISELVRAAVRRELRRLGLFTEKDGSGGGEG